MPMYNSFRYLGEAVESILGQILPDLEFVIVDDGSTDRSAQLLTSYARRDPRIRLLREDHGGVAKARNKGAEAARGEFLAVMDADDISLPERFERQVCYLRQNPACVAVGCQALVISPDGLPINERIRPTDHQGIENMLLKGRGGITHPTAMIRCDSFRKIGGYREQFEYSEDLDLLLRLGEHGQLANLPEKLFKYRSHIDSISHTKAALQRQNTLQIVREAHFRRGLEPPDEIIGVKTKVRSRVDWHYRYARQAIKDRRFRSAWSHVLGGLRLAPTKPHSWRMLVSALLMRQI